MPKGFDCDEFFFLICCRKFFEREIAEVIDRAEMQYIIRKVNESMNIINTKFRTLQFTAFRYKVAQSFRITPRQTRGW